MATPSTPAAERERCGIVLESRGLDEATTLTKFVPFPWTAVNRRRGRTGEGKFRRARTIAGTVRAVALFLASTLQSSRLRVGSRRQLLCVLCAWIGSCGTLDPHLRPTNWHWQPYVPTKPLPVVPTAKLSSLDGVAFAELVPGVDWAMIPTNILDHGRRGYLRMNAGATVGGEHLGELHLLVLMGELSYQEKDGLLLGVSPGGYLSIPPGVGYSCAAGSTETTVFVESESDLSRVVVEWRGGGQ